MRVRKPARKGRRSLAAEVGLRRAAGRGRLGPAIASPDSARLLFDANPQPMWIYDRRDLRFLAVNDAAVRHYGYSREEFLRMTVKDIRPVEDVPRLLEALAVQPFWMTYPEPWRHLKKDGTVLEVEVTAQEIRFAGRHARLVLAHDVTERLRATRELHENERRWRALFKSFPVPTYAWRRVGDDFVLTDYNDAGHAATGGRVAGVVGVAAAAFYPDMPEIRRDMERCLRDEAPVHREMAYRFRTTGEVRDMAVTYGYVPPDTVVVHAEDVTERKRAETALHEAHEEYRSLFDNAVFGIFRSTPEGRYIAANPALARIYGYDSPAELMATVTDIAQQLYEAPEDRAEFQRLLAERGEVSRFEARVRRKSGELIWISASARAVRGEAGTLRTYEGIVEDVTDRKRAEEERLRLLEQERRSRADAEAALERLSAIQSVTDAALAHLSLDELVSELLVRIRVVLATDTATILLVSEDRSHLTITATLGLSMAHARGVRVPMGGGIAGRIAATREPLVVDDMSRVDAVSPAFRRKVRSLLGVPLMVEGDVVGVIHVATRRPRHFSEDDQRLLQLVADRVAPAIDRARLSEERDRRMAQLHELTRASLDVHAKLSVGEALEVATRRAREIIGARESVSSLTVDGGHGQAVQHRSLAVSAAAGGDNGPEREQRAIAALVCPENRPMRMSQRQAEAHAAFQEQGQRAVRPRGWLAAPLVGHGGENLGLIRLSEKDAGDFTAVDQDMLVQLAQVASVAVENARLFEQVQAGRERLRSLSLRLVEVQEAERRAIARELHDEVGQLLTGLKLMLAAAGESAGSEARSLVNDLVRRVRDLSMDLRPPMLDDLGLLPALLWQLERFTAQTRVKVGFRHAGLDRRFPPEVETAAYRIVQEALTNVARHASVAEAWVRIRADPKALAVRIEDGGAGFVVQTALAGPSSGLAGMRERARLLGGRLTVESAPGAGTRLLAELPLSQPAHSSPPP
jgi:PAS domain S-box-containing protein